MAKKKQTNTTPPSKSRARTPPFSEYPEWSEAKFWSFLRSTLRSGFSKWPPKWQVLNEAKRPYTGEGKQQKWEYLCNCCGKYYKNKDVSVDHVNPAGQLSNWEHLVPFTQRLAVGTSKLQVLCRECHNAKTVIDKQNFTKE